MARGGSRQGTPGEAFGAAVVRDPGLVGLPVARVSFSETRSASPAVPAPDLVLVSQKMSGWTPFLCTTPPAVVLQPRDRFQMPRIYTWRVPTQVVDVESVRDVSNMEQVEETLGSRGGLDAVDADRDLSVSVLSGTSPDPAVAIDSVHGGVSRAVTEGQVS